MTFVAVTAMLSLVVPPMRAQALGGSATQSGSPGLVAQLQRLTGDKAQLTTSRATGLVNFLTTDPSRPVPKPNGTSTDAEAAGRAFLGTYGSLFGVSDQASMKVKNVRAADRGRRSVKFTQTRNGIPVIAGELVINLDAKGNTLSANGDTIDTSGVALTPSIAAGSAATAARRAVAKAEQVKLGAVRSGATKLAIYDSRLIGGPGPAGPRLVWRTNGISTDGSFNQLVLVDAHTGAIDLNFDTFERAKVRKVCDRNDVVGAPEACTTGAVRTEGQGATGITDVDHAYDFAGETYDFYKGKFGRDSLDNHGLLLNSTTRYCPDAANCPFANAFWNGSQMVYGNGLAVDDVVGHELTHGVTDFESSLYYFGQSGAINESMSDVFGELIDLTYTAGGGNDSPAVRWKIDEDGSLGVLRDMKNPPAFNQPDRMQSSLFTPDYADQNGVHTNSGVNNKAAYLLTDGATFNGKTVTGLGIDKVARIYYEAQVHLLTSGSDYADLYNILPQACKNLTGTSGITAANCVQVKNAVDATQMNLQPVTGVSTPQAPLCPAGQIPANKFFDNLENTGSGNWAKTHVSGSSGWQYPVSGANENATSGSQNFFGPDPTNGVSDLRISRTASTAIPATGSTYLRFNHLFDMEYQFDGGVVEYSTDNGTTYHDAGPLFDSNGYNATIDSTSSGPLAGRQAFSGFLGGYASSRINLTSLHGQNVRFRFRIGSDESVGYQGWFIDDVRVYQCVAGSSAPTVNAGPDKTVNNGAAFTLSATGVDPEGKTLAYNWVQLSGPTATIIDPRARVASVNGVGGGSGGQNLSFRVTATDSQGLTATDTVNVHVNPK